MSYFQHKTVENFGRAILRAGDLDPVYELLFQSSLDGTTLYRWMVAYWLFYHVGVASWITEQKDFYRAALHAFDNNLPRGTERRHFRGAVPRAALVTLSERFGDPADIVPYVYADNFQECRRKVLTLPMFGPWIAFKVADMLERCAGMHIWFDPMELAFYDQPALGAVFVYNDERYAARAITSRRDGRIAGKREDRVIAVVTHLLDLFNDTMAPPSLDRGIGVQEVETILCKYKSHRNGTYPIGKDRREVAHALDHWGDLAKSLKEGIEW